VDLFVASYPLKLASHGCACVFDVEPPPDVEPPDAACGEGAAHVNLLDPRFANCTELLTPLSVVPVGDHFCRDGHSVRG
jgi:hypothetical protein